MNNQEKNRIFVKENSIYLRRLSELMIEKSLSQSELGRLTGIKQATISDYIKGKSIPSAERFCLIAAALGVSMDYLWGISNTPDLAKGEQANESEYKKRALQAERKLTGLLGLLKNLGQQVESLGENVGKLTSFISE